MAAGGVLVFLSHLAVLCEGGVAVGSEVVGVDVPSVGVVGGGVNLTCRYDLRGPDLYSLKWYHNDTEFYRYVPTEEHRPVDIRPSLTFLAHEVSRSGAGVTVGLTALTGAASGEYKCEVIAERPSFRTEVTSGFMTVLEEPLPSPVIEGGRRGAYEWGEEVQLRCVVGARGKGRLPSYSPPPSLYWYIDATPVQTGYVHQETGDGSVTLQVPAAQLWRRESREDAEQETRINEEGRGEEELDGEGGRVEEEGDRSVVVECVLRVGGQEVRDRQTITIRKSPSTYLSNYFSAAGVTILPTSIILTVSLLSSLACWQRRG